VLRRGREETGGALAGPLSGSAFRSVDGADVVRQGRAAQALRIRHLCKACDARIPSGAEEFSLDGGQNRWVEGVARGVFVRRDLWLRFLVPACPPNTRFSCEDGAKRLPGAGFVSCNRLLGRTHSHLSQSSCGQGLQHPRRHE
jgi:hypothetical protein